MLALKEKVLPLGGFWWQLMDTGAMQNFAHFKSPDQCKAALRQSCSKAGTDKWGRMQVSVSSISCSGVPSPMGLGLGQ